MDVERVASMLLTAGPYLQRVLLEHKGPEQSTVEVSKIRWEGICHAREVSLY